MLRPCSRLLVRMEMLKIVQHATDKGWVHAENSRSEWMQVNLDEYWDYNKYRSYLRWSCKHVGTFEIIITNTWKSNKGTLACSKSICWVKTLFIFPYSRLSPSLSILISLLPFAVSTHSRPIAVQSLSANSPKSCTWAVSRIQPRRLIYILLMHAAGIVLAPARKRQWASCECLARPSEIIDFLIRGF